MARLIGKHLFASFDGITLTTDFRGGEEKRTAKLIDTSAGDDDNMTYALDKKDGTYSVEFVDDSAHAAFNACEEGTEGDLVWGPQGNGAGKPKFTVNAFVSNRSRSNPYGDVMLVTVEFQASGPVAEGTFSA